MTGTGGPLTVANLFSISGLLADLDGDGLPETIRALLVIGQEAVLPEQRAAIDISARLCFESLSLQLPLVTCEPAAVAEDRIALYIGRAGTLASLCPATFVSLVDSLGPEEGVVAVAAGPRPSVLVGGGNAHGLTGAVRALVADAGSLAARAVPRDDGLEVVRIQVETVTSGMPEESTGPAIDIPPLRSLADLFGPQGFSVDSDGDLLPDLPRTTLVVPDDLSVAEAVAAAHLGARLGLESLGLAFPMALRAEDGLPDTASGVRIVIEPLSSLSESAACGSIRLQNASNGQVVAISGSAQGRLAALETLAGLDAWTPEEQPALAVIERSLERLCRLADPLAGLCAVPHALQQLSETLADKVQDGKAGPAPLLLQVTVPHRWPVEPASLRHLVHTWQQNLLPDRPGEVHVEAVHSATLIDETERLAWEVDEAWRVLRGEVLPAIAALPNDSTGWFVDLRLSEPAGRREALRRRLLREIRARGHRANDAQVRVLPVYHQGRAWILEELVPLLLKLPVARIRIRVQQFTAEKESLELPIRWLQDLFPVDELLCSRLALPPDAVALEVVGGLAQTYEVDALDEQGNIVLQSGFTVTAAARPYLRAYPRWGVVHSVTGCVRLLLEGSPVVDRRLRTDPERAWDYIQESLLPRLGAEIRRACGGVPSRDRQPFFGSLFVDVWLSEEDESIGVREERSSPLESLHEDLYFMLLDYCTALMSAATGEPPYLPPWIAGKSEEGFQRNARAWTAPGLIVPRIHRHDGAAGRLQVRLTAAEPPFSVGWRCGNATGVLALHAAPGAEIRITGIDVHPGGMRAPHLLLAVDGPAADCDRAREMFAAWADAEASSVRVDAGLPPQWSFGLDSSSTSPGSRRTIKPAGSPASTPVVTAAGDPALPEDGRHEADIPLHRVLSRSEVETAIGRLGRLPGVHAYRAGRSARGRDVMALEITPPRDRGWWSRAKLSGWKCTLLLNGRHHANEPSSTGALLRLAELLAHDNEWRKYLERVNVVLIPAENVDGVDVYDELRDEHPNWMLHAARYNAAGLEHAAAYGDADTRHTEAVVLPAVWRRWAPDIFCDNHGFPSHAWEQLFSGHCNPWYQAFWIPQGLIYAYVPAPTPYRYPAHFEASGALSARLVEALADDAEIAAWNGDHAERYQAFMQSRLPDRFPAVYDRGVLIHRSTYDPDSAGAGLAGFPGLYPGVTTCSIVTEVADETAQGDYLALCAGAHLLADRSLLQYLFDANGPAQVRRELVVQSNGRVVLRATRPRPVLASPTSGNTARE